MPRSPSSLNGVRSPEIKMFDDKSGFSVFRTSTSPSKISIEVAFFVSLASMAAQIFLVILATMVGFSEGSAMLLSGCLIYGTAITYIAKDTEQHLSRSERIFILGMSGIWFFIGMVQFFGFRPFFRETNIQTILGFLGILTLYTTVFAWINRRFDARHAYSDKPRA
jgi:uncharacterized membrane protein YGL010W